MAMHQRLKPWIEELILSYGTENRGPVGDHGFLMGHIINVTSMPASQTQSSEYIDGLIFLSDGVLQIPALLTVSIWERLQYECDQETFHSLVNAVVCLRGFKLHFHASAIKKQSRFYLAIVDMLMLTSCFSGTDASSSVYPSSVHNKINQTWMNLRNQDRTLEEELENNNLTLLLREWECDTVAEVLENVRRKLTTNWLWRRSQPSTSTKTQHSSSASTATGWERDRTRFKNQKLFSVPVKCLLMSEEGAPQLQPVFDCEMDGSTNTVKTFSGGKQASGEDSKAVTPASRPSSPPVSRHASPPASRPASPSVFHHASGPASPHSFPPASCHASPPASRPASHPVSSSASHNASSPTSHHASGPTSCPASHPASPRTTPPAGVPVSPEKSEEVTWPVSDSRHPVFSNPWDMFPSPCTNSTCTTPASSLGDQPSLDAGKPRIRLCPYRPSHVPSMTDNSFSSAQSVCCLLPSTTSTKTHSRPFSELRNSQLLVQNTGLSLSTLDSNRDESLPPFQRPPLELTGYHLSPASPELLTSPVTSAADLEVAPERRAPKRKNSHGQERPSFDLEKPSCSSTQKESIKETESGRTRAIHGGQVHPCGAPFSYTYKTTAQNIQDFKNFKVEKPVLCWAISYLLNEGEGSANNNSCD